MQVKKTSSPSQTGSRGRNGLGLLIRSPSPGRAIRELYSPPGAARVNLSIISIKLKLKSRSHSSLHVFAACSLALLPHRRQHPLASSFVVALPMCSGPFMGLAV